MHITIDAPPPNFGNYTHPAPRNQRMKNTSVTQAYIMGQHQYLFVSLC